MTGNNMDNFTDDASPKAGVPTGSGAVELVPKYIGQFDTFQHWVNRATRYLTGHRGTVGEEVKPICVDTLGRRCHVGADFMRARDEKTFPVRFFLECEPSPTATPAMKVGTPAQAESPGDEVQKGKP